MRRRGFLASPGATALGPFEYKLESIRRGVALPRRPSDRDLHEWERVLAQLPERARRLPAVQDYRKLLADPAAAQPSVR